MKKRSLDLLCVNSTTWDSAPKKPEVDDTNVLQKGFPNWNKLNLTSAFPNMRSELGAQKAPVPMSEILLEILSQTHFWQRLHPVFFSGKQWWIAALE